MNAEQEKTLKKVNAAVRPLLKSCSMPVLQCAKLEDGRAHWTNLDVWVTAEDTGTPNGMVFAGQLETWIETGCNITQPPAPEDFPVEPDEAVTLDPAAVIPGPALAAACAFKSPDKTRPVLTGVLIESADSMTRIVAMDTYSMAVIDTNGTRLAEGLSVVVNGDAATLAAKLAGKGPVDVRMGEHWIMLSVDCDGLRVHIRSREVPGQYPNYRQLIPKTETLSYDRVTAGVLTNVTKRAGKIACNMMIRKDAGGLRYFSRTEAGDIIGLTPESETADANLPMTAGFNAAYLGKTAGLAKALGETPKKTAAFELAFGMPAKDESLGYLAKPAIVEIGNEDINVTGVIMPVCLK